MKLDVDIGTWEKGRTVTINASTKKEAIEKAGKALKKHYANVDGAYVVQIYNAGRKVKHSEPNHVSYDYFNGWLSSGKLA